MKKRFAVIALALACVCACLFGLVACGNGNEDQQHLEGVWQVRDSKVTYVFTEDKFKMVGTTYDYTIDSSNKTITFKNGSMTGSSKYSFDSDYKELTLEQDDGNGGTTTTIFDKVSDDTSAEPSADAKTDTTGESSDSSSEASE